MPAKGDSPATEEPKVEPQPGVMATVGNALNPMVGINVVEKVGPLVILVTYLGIYGALMFDLIPKPEVAVAVLGIIGPFVGGLLIRMGRT